MASYTKLPSGQWRARVRKNGASVSKSFPTKAMSTAWAVTEESDLKSVEAGLSPNKTVGELFDAYLAKSPSSKTHIGLVAKHIKRDMPLKALTSTVVRSWQEARLKEVSEASVLREKKILSAAINYGIKKLKWLRENPLHATDSITDGAPRSSVWTDEQIERFKIASGWVEGECLTDTARVCACLLFSLETAMRSSEILRAKKSDITGKVLHIPKTKNGHARHIPLSNRALEIVAMMPEIDDTIFCLTDASRDALFRKVMKRAEIEGVNFHSARRTALTRMAKLYSVLELSRISGHLDLSILSKHYYAPDMESLAARLDE